MKQNKESKIECKEMASGKAGRGLGQGTPGREQIKGSHAPKSIFGPDVNSWSKRKDQGREGEPCYYPVLVKVGSGWSLSPSGSVMRSKEALLLEGTGQFSEASYFSTLLFVNN